MRSYIRWFREIRLADVPLVGGKNASLGELYSELTEAGVRVPNGFAITADAYTALLETNGLHDQMARLLKGLSGEDLPALAEVGAALRRLVAEAPLPPGLEDDVVAAYRTLCREYGPGLAVAVRSSATAEDLPEASFAGLHETYLGVRGDSALLTACRRCFASLFTDRAIAYRIHQGFDHLSVRLSVGVQKMVRADRGAAGVMFTLDPESGFRDVVLINSAYGFGEAVVGGQINPDEFWIFKPTLGTGYHAILKRVLGRKEWKLVSADGGATARVEVPPEARLAPSLSDPEALELAGYAVAIEAHYSRKFQRPTPMDVEWAKDGEDGRLYILQARPETVHRAERPSVIEVFTLGEAPVRQRLVAGKAIGEKIGVGRARRLLDPRFLDRFRPGEVLVTPMTDPDWEPIMKRAAAIVTDRGGRTCFAGETKILTSRGFRTMEELYEASGDLLVPSLNRQTLKIEWKPILRVVKRRAPVIEVSTSLTGRQDTNTLRLTPDHKMVAVQRRQLVDREIACLLNEHEHVLVAGRVPCLGDAPAGGRLPAYLVGALSTDGHVGLTSRRGAVTFIQKPTAEKEAFIAAVVDGMTVAYGKGPSISEKPLSSGTIRGKPARGTANAYRWHRKQIAADLLWEQERMVETLLASDEDVAYDFLGGVVDGDGAYGSGAHRISVYCSKPALTEAIVVASLRVGILPQVTRNRNIANIQLVEGLEEIGRRARRVKVQGARRRVGTRFFAARPLLADIVGEVNVGGHIRPYVENNLLIGADKIAELLP
ncbi:MAG: phosphoenolpyruvate synthase, partial [Candidatus Rokubacteria bacterium]|nr:phosphoenolpyruvate synthase [Candidatus Rokubacteria bacterium]